jgi:alpha-tubulin suppressor-like RCC1 family protein
MITMQIIPSDNRRFGGGEHSQLAHNDRVNKLKPTLVQALEGVFISQVTCGWSHSVALTSDGRGMSVIHRYITFLFVFLKT